MIHRHAHSVPALVSVMAAGLAVLAGCEAGPAAPADGADRLSAAAPSLAMTKVDVCHRDLSGDYTLISIADAAYDTHVDHGDASPGEAVPGMDGHVFDDQCQPVEAVCPCYQSPLDIGDLFGADLSYLETTDGWVWRLSDFDDFEYAQVSYDGQYSCEISTYRTQAAYSPISEPAAYDCIEVLQAYDESF